MTRRGVFWFIYWAAAVASIFVLEPATGESVFMTMVLVAIAYAIVKSIREGWKPSTGTLVAAAALLLYGVLGWTHGNKIGEVKLVEPLNWPLQLRILETIPGVDSEGACFEPNTEPGVFVDPGSRFEDPVEHEITPEDAARMNADARACIAEARRQNRDYTKLWANWMSALLLLTAGLAIYANHRRESAAQRRDGRRGDLSR